MSADELEALLDAWEDARERGETLTPEALCRDRPDLLPELIERIQELCEADEFLGSNDDQGWAGTMPSEAPEVLEVAPAATAGERYADERFLAEGGLGVVFIARDVELPRDVALKRLQDRLLYSRESRLRFMLEAEITARLEHPGVVPVYGLGTDARGQPFYAMRLIRGETIAETIHRFHAADVPGRDPGERGVALQALLRAFLTACQTIAYAHSRGVIHRDIKPANIMLGEYGEALVVDWGLAKPAGARPDAPDVHIPAPRGLDETKLGSVKGSPIYMSPEQAAGRWNEVGPPSDVYALGATLYTLLTGARPFDGKSVSEVLARVRIGEITPIRRAKASVPRALEAVCVKAMRLNSADRYLSALDLAADIERWLSGEPVRAWREPWPDRCRRWARRHRVLVASVVAALAVGSAVLAVTNGQLRSLAQRLDRSNQSLDLSNRSLDQTNKNLTTALDSAESNLYARDLDLADRAWWDAQPRLTARYLEDAPANRRGWEWRYLARRNRPGIFQSTLAELPLALGFAEDGSAPIAATPLGIFRYPTTNPRASRVDTPSLKSIRRAALAPDGVRLGVVTTDRPDAALIVDLRNPQAPAAPVAGIPGEIESLAFAPSGGRVALAVVRRGGADANPKDKLSFETEFEAQIVVRNPQTGAVTISDVFTSSGVLGPMTVTPDAAVFCTVYFGQSGFLYTLRPDSNRVQRVWPRLGDEENVGRGLALAPSGKWVAGWSDDHAVIVRDLTTGKTTATFRGHSERVRCLAFSGDETRLASSSDDRTIRVWSLAQPAPTVVLRGHAVAANVLAFSKDHAKLLSVAGNDLVAWDATTSSEAIVQREPEHAHLAELAVGQGGQVAVISAHQVEWRDPASGRLVAPADEALTADTIAAAPGVPWFALATESGPIDLRLPGGKSLGQLSGHRSRATSLAASRDGSRLASVAEDGFVYVWDVAARKTFSVVKPSAGDAPPSVVAISPDGTRVAYGSTDAEVVLHDSARSVIAHRLKTPGSPVRRLQFSPDASRLLIVRSAGLASPIEGASLTLWNTASGSLSATLDDHPDGLTDAAFSPDGLRVASADRAGKVRLWETATGRLLLTLQGPSSPISRLAFTPDGSRLFAVGGRIDSLARRTDETAEFTIWDARPLAAD